MQRPYSSLVVGCATVDPMTLVSQIAELQNYATYKELSWEGSFEDYLGLVRRNPKVTRNAFQRIYDMIISYGDRGVHRQQEEADPLQLLQGRSSRRQRRHLRPRRPADAPRERPQERGAGLRHREARHPPARPGRLVEVHHRAPAKKGIEDYSRTPDGALYTFDWTLPGELSELAGGSETLPVPDERGAAAPHPARVARRRHRRARSRQRRLQASRSTAISTRRAASSSRS